jgi:hypothetical protein
VVIGRSGWKKPRLHRLRKVKAQTVPVDRLEALRTASAGPFVIAGHSGRVHHTDRDGGGLQSSRAEGPGLQSLFTTISVVTAGPGLSISLAGRRYSERILAFSDVRRALMMVEVELLAPLRCLIACDRRRQESQ